MRKFFLLTITLFLLVGAMGLFLEYNSVELATPAHPVSYKQQDYTLGQLPIGDRAVVDQKLLNSRSFRVTGVAGEVGSGVGMYSEKIKNSNEYFNVFLTCRHVCDEGVISIDSVTQGVYVKAAFVFFLESDLDAAVIVTRSSLPLFDQPFKINAVDNLEGMAAGYPGGKVYSQFQGSLGETIVNKKKADFLLIQDQKRSLKGISGGAVIDGKGFLIGIAESQGLSDLQFLYFENAKNIQKEFSKYKIFL